ncbi:MAG: response regulator transcription factor [Chthoniobacter sp.]
MPPKLAPKSSKFALVEDHLMFREWLGQMLGREPVSRSVGRQTTSSRGCASSSRLRRTSRSWTSRCAGSSGLELVKDMKAHGLAVPVLVLSMHDEALYAERVLRAGAKGYISKSEASSTLTEAIRQVLAGKIYLGEKMTTMMLEKITNPRAMGTGSRMDLLADRELEVFQLIGRGYNGREIAQQLHLGETTIDTYRARIKEKLQLRNAAELYSRAAQWVQENGT